MPGLLRGAARTAVVAGTATAVSGRVAHRQQQKWAQQDQQTGYGAPPQQYYAEPAPAPAPAPAAAPQASMVDQLKELAELKEQGILTEEEFAAQKAKILGS